MPPDIEVEQTPKDVIAGRDPQLERRSQVVMEELKKTPPPQPKRPAYPNKTLPRPTTTSAGGIGRNLLVSQTPEADSGRSWCEPGSAPNGRRTLLIMKRSDWPPMPCVSQERDPRFLRLRHPWHPLGICTTKSTDLPRREHEPGGRKRNRTRRARHGAGLDDHLI